MRDASVYSNSLFSSFQDQLDEYEAERNALLCQNNQAKDEVDTLKVLYSQWFASKYHSLEWFSVDYRCRKTKIKVLSLADHNRRKQRNEPIRIQSKYM